MTADDRDQRIADWHEGRAGTDQELHEYLGMTWAEYCDWLNPLTRSAAMTDQDEKFAGLLRQVDALETAASRVPALEAAVRENHDWHQAYDEYGYPGSALEQTNRAALGLPPRKPPHTLGAIPTRRLEDQIKDFQALLTSGTLELDVVLLSAVLCIASIQELRQFGLFTQPEAQLWRQHVRALFIAHRPADLDRFNAAMAQREFKEPGQ